VSSTSRSTVLKYLYKLHYAESIEEYEHVKIEALEAYNTLDDLPTFACYLQNQWLDSPYSNWQCFRTQTGHAKTNNPAETFIKMIKRDYPKMRKNSPMCESLNEILKKCKNVSVTKKEFVEEYLMQKNLNKKIFNLWKNINHPTN
jgi:hypothetical protein